MKIVKSLEGSGLIKKKANEAIENESTEQKGQFLDMLLGIFGPSLLGDLLVGKGVKIWWGNH